MKDLYNYINETLLNESRISCSNVHDAILNVLFKYYSKMGVSQEVKDYCDTVREALNTIKK